MVRDDLYNVFARVGCMLVPFLQLNFHFIPPPNKEKEEDLYDALKNVEMMSYVI